MAPHHKALLLLLALTTAGCNVQSQGDRAVIHEWPLADASTAPADIRVESASIFYCNGVRSRLLGVKELDDPELRKQGLDFSRRWFDEIGNYIGIDNADNPLQDKDGTCVVWISGGDMYGSCLGLELVRAGLANVDYTSLTEYNFMVPGKDHDYQETWREQLDEAAEDFKKGVKPRVLFDWPPTENGVEPKTSQTANPRGWPHMHIDLALTRHSTRYGASRGLGSVIVSSRRTG